MADKPVRTDPPDYPEREPEHRRPPMRRRKTGEISLEEVQRFVRDQAQTGPWKLGALIGGLLLGGGGGGAFAYMHSDDDQVTERQNRELNREVRELRDKVQQAQIDIARCCR